MEKCLKNRENTGTNYEQYPLKIIKILRTASLRANFTGSYNKKECNLHQKFTRRLKTIS